jgi:hypothetical protein
MSRTTETTVTFARPFRLPPLEAPQPPGVYRVMVDEDEVPGLSFLAFHRTATMLALPAIGAAAGTTQLVTVRPEDLEAALERDRAPA